MLVLLVATMTRMMSTIRVCLRLGLHGVMVVVRAEMEPPRVLQPAVSTACAGAPDVCPQASMLTVLPYGRHILSGSGARLMQIAHYVSQACIAYTRVSLPRVSPQE